jgi:NUMOD3 motif
MSESKHIYIVYRTTCLVNQKIYIGEHKQKPGFGPFEFDGYLGSGDILKPAIKKHRKENFVRETLFVYDNEDEAYAKEKEIVNVEFIARPDTYNLKVGGRGRRDGHIVSEEQKQKQSKAIAGRKHTEETKQKLSASMKGKKRPPFTEEAKANMSKAHKGKKLSPHTEEQNKRKSERQKGKKHTEEQNKRKSERQKGRKVTEETKQKISEANKDRILTEETKQKMSDAKKGKKKPIITCPHCGKSGGSNMKRFHFDNCKHKGSEFL